VAAAPSPSDLLGGAGPLCGVTVLDLSTVGPASRCTRLLADYCARVVKVAPVLSADARCPSKSRDFKA
jgi:crotonobetainyl-CoA:carnitine CoA-transferase CaiB-like acyl-CoA transferase